MAVRSPRTRSLWPREHGAYVQLLVPLATALGATRPTLAGGLIALGAVLAFLASEPLRVVLGDRGPRMRAQAGARARVRLGWLVVVAVLAGGLGLGLAPVALPIAGLIAIPIAIVVVLSRQGAVHTVVGESLAAVALAGAAAPVAVAGGLSPRGALVIWGAWSLGYATSVIAVHHVIARHQRASSLADVPRALALTLLCAAIAALGLHDPTAWFAIPLAALAAVVLARPPRATRLRALGIGFLVLSLAAAAFAIVTVRSDLNTRAPHGHMDRTPAGGLPAGRTTQLAPAAPS